MNRNAKKRAASQILNRIIAYSLLMLAMGGGFAVVTVWIRHQTTRAAINLQAIERNITKERRELAQLEVELAIAMSTDKLIDLNRTLKLGLREPAYTQIVHVTENVETRLYDKNANSVFTASISSGN